MNPSDSKLGKVDDLQHYMEATSKLSARVKEQDREIEELQLGKEAAERLNRMNVKVADGETDRAEKLEKENEELKRMLSVPHN